MLEGDGGEGGVAVGGVVIEGALVDGGSGLTGDGYGVVGREGVEDVDIVGPGDGVECSGEVALFVFGEMRMEMGADIWRDGIAGVASGIRVLLSG